MPLMPNPDPSTAIVTVIAATIIAIPVAITALLHHNTRRPTVKVPYPPPSPVLGNLPEVISNFHRYNELFYEHALKYGPTWALLAPTLDRTLILMTVDPAVVEHVLKGNFDNYIKGPLFHELLEPMLGDGIFNTDGDEWRWQRKVSSHIFTGRNFRDVLSKVITEEINILVEQISLKADTSESVDVYAYLHNFTMDTFGKVAFGVELDTLTKGTSDFAVAFDTANTILAHRFSNPIYQLSEWWTGQSRILNKCVVTIRKFADDRIKEKRELLATGVDDVAKKGYRDLLDLYLDVNVEGKGLTDKQLRDMVLNMMIAGRDTTAQSLSWAIWLLSSRPKVVEAIRKELDEMTNGEVPTYDEVSTLKYANAVFLETLRLYPSVPANIKICVKEDILPGGLHIPKGTEINWLPYAMGRMESIWGPDATEFIPERWIDANGNIKREPIHKFPAFNGGPRTCLGQQMAMVEGVMALVALTSKFDLVLDPEAKVASGVGLTLNMSSGLKMQVKLRQ